MKHLKNIILLATFIPTVACSQKIDPGTYSVLKDFFKETQATIKFPFVLHTEILGYNNHWISFDSVLQGSFFQEELYLKNKDAVEDIIFSERDLQYMKNQVQSYRTSSFLNLRKLEKAGIHCTDSLSKEQLLNPQPTIYRASLPLFSKNRQKALLYTEYHCIGDCGAGDLHILIKKKGKWYLLASINVWVS